MTNMASNNRSERHSERLIAEERPFLAGYSNEQLCRLMAAQLKAERLRRDWTQEFAARQANLPLRTYCRLERLGNGSIENLMALLKAFNRQMLVAVLFPGPAPGATSREATGPKPRRRASGARGKL